MYACVHVCVYAFMHVRMYACTHVRIEHKTQPTANWQHDVGSRPDTIE